MKNFILRRLPVWQLVAAACLILCSFFVTYSTLKFYGSVTLAHLDANQSVDRPFVITTRAALGDIDTADIEITPKIQGAWQHERGHLLGIDRLVFVPNDRFKVNTDYSVSLPRANRFLTGKVALSKVQFKTETAPNLKSVGVVAIKDGATIQADYAFTATLSGPNKNLRNIELQSTPSIAAVSSIKNDTEYSWKPEGLLPQGQSLTLKIVDTKNAIVLAEKTVRVANEPTIAQPVKRHYFGEHDIATIVFNQPIDTSSDQMIQFSLPGKGEWQNDTTYSFTPTKVQAGQTYSYTIKAGLRSKDGGVLTIDKTESFSTVGRVSLTASSPRGSDKSQASQAVSFTFDQPVDHASVESRFSISAGTIKNFSWRNTTMTALVENFGYQQNVTASIAAGVINTGFGLPSNVRLSTSFTTEARTRQLAVPFFRQQHAATCAVASLRMALAYYGVGSDEMGIVNKMGYAPRNKDTSTNPPKWDDPQEMFVGSVDGSITAGTAAGPDAPPVARVAQAYGRGAAAVNGINVQWIAQQIYNGNPVVSFGAFSNTGMTSWQTPSGGTAKMNLTSHAVVVTGVKGEPSSPLGFWVNDPSGGVGYWTADRLQRSINMDAYNQAVVVY